MEVNFWLVCLPALISLSVKGGIYAYAHLSRTHSLVTRLYLLTLFAFSIQNVAEIAHFYVFIERGAIPTFEVNMFYAASIAAYAFLFHLSLALAVSREVRVIKIASSCVYLYAIILELMLFLTHWLIIGYAPIRDYTVTRIPGPLYSMLETYGMGIVISALAIVSYGIKRQASKSKKAQLKIVLVGMAPLNLLVIAVLVALRMGVRDFNASIAMPIALIFFLVVTAYATHQYRLFDVEFFIPWSKVRKRKTEFYRRIQRTIGEIAGMHSVQEILDRVARILRCGVALVGGPRPIVALVRGQQSASEEDSPSTFPQAALRNIERIVVAEEIAETDPELYRLMKRHRVGAVVPFQGEDSSPHWMVLGEHFNRRVYTPLDFHSVETLFRRITDRFLEDQLLQRAQLEQLHDENAALDREIVAIESDTAQIDRDNALMEDANRRLREDTAQLRREGLHLVKAAPVGHGPATPRTLRERLDEVESWFVEAALTHFAGDVGAAARRLGVSAHAMRQLMQRHGLGEPGPAK